MSGKTQLRLLISVALVFFAIILLYSLFFSQPVKLYSIAATQHSAEISQEEAGQSAVASSVARAAKTDASSQIDLNSATKDDLMGIDGIGEVLASRIVEYRDAHGAFKSVSELMNVEGIGDAKLEALLQVLYVS